MTERSGRGDGVRGLVTPLIGMLVTVAAWVVLVMVAIRFGERGSEGDTVAWVFSGLAGLGAAACLVVALVLGRQLLVAAGVVNDYRGKRARR